MSGYKEICLVLVLVCLSPAIAQRNLITRPAYKITYTVKYNINGSVPVTNECAQHYGQEFLLNFKGLETLLGAICKSQGHNDVKVLVYLTATVWVKKSQASLYPSLNVTALRDTTSPQTLKACGMRINRTFAYLDHLSGNDDQFLRIMKIKGKPSSNCSHAVMSPRKLEMNSSKWVCPEHMTLQVRTMSCVPVGNDASKRRRRTVRQHPAYVPLSRNTHYRQTANPSTTVSMTTSPHKVGTTSAPNIQTTTAEDGCPKGMFSCADRDAVESDVPSCSDRCPSLTNSDTQRCSIWAFRATADGRMVCYLETLPTVAATRSPRISTAEATSTVHTTYTPATSTAVTGTPPSSSSHGAATLTAVSQNPVISSQGPTMEPAVWTTTVTQSTETVTQTASSVTEVVTLEPTPKRWEITVLNHTVGRTINIHEGPADTLINIAVYVDFNLLCGSADCKVHFEYRFRKASNHPKCRDGRRIPQVVVRSGRHTTDKCAIEITRDNPSRNISIPLRAKLDFKYDGRQSTYLGLSLKKTVNDNANMTSWPDLKINIIDHDRKATCSSINDPHISTFDGLEYNNYYHGEFVLYKHETLPYSVHAVYQACGRAIQASCNCAVAVQAGDDVFVIERCFRNQKPVKPLQGESKDITQMRVDLFLNGKLTPGTKIYQQADGQIYIIYLPHGLSVKIMVNNLLLNIWLLASPADFKNTEGLCGVYDGDKENDIRLPNGHMEQYNFTEPREDRPQFPKFSTEWRVDINGPNSTLRGVPMAQASEEYEPPVYCDCDVDTRGTHCAPGMEVEWCDDISGIDITQWMVDNAKTPVLYKKVSRRKRSIENDVLKSVDDPATIKVDKNFIPPVYNWKGDWNKANATKVCRDRLVHSTVGAVCSNLPGVNVDQDIKTCVEDIQIIGDKSFLNSAVDAMKQQCQEELKRNDTLRKDSDLVTKIEGAMCINDCSQHGKCKNGSCVCDKGYASADCSVSTRKRPYVSEIPNRGLCDLQSTNCSKVKIYGHKFVNSSNLTCHLEETKVDKSPYILRTADPHKFIKERATFNNFNEIECLVPRVHNKAYLIRVSNDGKSLSYPLLYIPYDPRCHTCDGYTRNCTRRPNTCIIDDRCYQENEHAEGNPCLVCQAVQNSLQWTQIGGAKCRPTTVASLPTEVVGLIAAAVGTVLGIVMGFAVYKCCCKRKATDHGRDSNFNRHREDSEPSPLEDAMIHRNRGLPDFTDPRRMFPEPMPRHQRYEETFFHNTGEGVENGVDDTTYF